MTDARSNSYASVVVDTVLANSKSNSIATVAVVAEQAQAANDFEFAIVAVSAEFIIPKLYTPLGCGQFMATMPYFIGN